MILRILYVKFQGMKRILIMILWLTAATAPAFAQQVTVLTNAQYRGNGTQLLGIDAEQGSLEKDKKADFIVLDKDPLTDIHNTLSIDAVWKDGVKISDGPLTQH